MQSAQETHEEWTDGDTGVRPMRVQALRTEIRNYTDHSPPRRIGEIVGWLDEHAEDVADGLAEAAGDEPDPNDGEEDEPDEGDLDDIEEVDVDVDTDRVRNQADGASGGEDEPDPVVDTDDE